MEVNFGEFDIVLQLDNSHFVPMGVHKVLCSYSRRSKISLSSDVKGKQTADNPVLEPCLEDDSDSCDITESSCELGMVDGQSCCIPYELYDLPDLREILSLDAWNSCLMEEERFTLTAFLPDMDQHTFCLTMKEIFDGSNIYFGNPLDIFFRRLKGGYYPPKVSRYRDGLQFLQRKKYYHSLRLYHDGMVKMFADTRRIWDLHGNNLGVEERISLWTKSRNQKRVNLLDLNKSPSDGHTLNEEFNLHTNGVVPMESKISKDILPSLPANGSKFFAPNCRARGVLKVKSGNGSFQNHNPKILNANILVQSQSVPKGVLKMVPKVSSTWLGHSEPTFLVRTQGFQDVKLSSLPASLQPGGAKDLYESAFQRQKVDGGRICPILDQPPCLQNQQENSVITNSHRESSTRKMKMEMASSLYDNGIFVFGKHKLFGCDARSPDKGYGSMDPMTSTRYLFNDENLWPDSVTTSRDFSLKSLESYPFDIQCHGGEPRMALTKEEHIANYPRAVKVVPRISDVGIGMQERLVSSSSNRLRGNECALPLTYKRRKALAKVNSLDFNEPLTAEADLKLVTKKESSPE